MKKKIKKVSMSSQNSCRAQFSPLTFFPTFRWFSFPSSPSVQEYLNWNEEFLIIVVFFRHCVYFQPYVYNLTDSTRGIRQLSDISPNKVPQAMRCSLTDMDITTTDGRIDTYLPSSNRPSPLRLSPRIRTLIFSPCSSAVPVWTVE